MSYPEVYRHAATVSPSNTVDLPQAGVLVAQVAGNAAVHTVKGDIVTIGLAAGVPSNLLVRRVLVTGTTATGIVVQY